jgi:hypothetical protein
MPLRYDSGEAIMLGDRVTYAGEPARIIEIGDPDVSAESWIVGESGGGAMIEEVQPRVFGMVLVADPEHDEDLIFVRRDGESRPDSE